MTNRLTITLDLDNPAMSSEPHVPDEVAIAEILARYAQRLLSVGVNHAPPGCTVELFTILDPNDRPLGKFEVSA